MKAIILAAGYGTRLEIGLNELKVKDLIEYKKIKDAIEGKHKALVEIRGKPLIHYTVENILRAGIRDVFVVTNSKFLSDFEKWKSDYKGKALIDIVDDGTETNEDRLGAAGDFYFLLNERNIEGDVLLIGGDNLLTFELEDLVKFYNEKNTNILIAYWEEEKARILRANFVEYNENNFVTNFVEKPKSSREAEWVCPPFYIYQSEAVKRIRAMEMTDDIEDQIGNLPVVLHKVIPFHVLLHEGRARFDLGSIDDYRKAEEYIKSLEKK